MGETQKRILGVAYTINAHTQGGTARVKSTTRSDGWKIPSVVWDGIADFQSNLGIYAVYGLIPNPQLVTRVSGGYESSYEMCGQLWNRKHSPEARRAGVAIAKGNSSLLARGMLHYVIDSRGCPQGTYILTSNGLELGKELAVDVPEIDLAIAVFLEIRAVLPEWRLARDELIRRRRLLQPIA